ncbi:MAG: hypothetical protein K2Z81_03885, partial [Cyanobacteria bacterium]|nr:hypothetical protein [Cyanobacteriota bacterium]
MPNFDSAAFKSHFAHEGKEGSWVAENVLKPAYNAGIVTPNNAISNATMGALPRLDFEHVKEAATLSPEWFAQNASSGIASVAPYVVAGKFGCRSLRAGGSML